MARVAPCFARRETRLTCRDMVNGLLCELEDCNCWTLAEAAGHASPYRMQHLLSRARVDERQLLDAAADWAADEERREFAGVPDEVMFATKPQLAGDLLRHAHDRGIRAGFAAGGEVYGGLELRKNAEPRRDQSHRDAWALWRCRHQYGARQAHQRWHAYADETPR